MRRLVVWSVGHADARYRLLIIPPQPVAQTARVQGGKSWFEPLAELKQLIIAGNFSAQCVSASAAGEHIPPRGVAC